MVARVFLQENQELSNNDHKFNKFLKSKGWTGRTKEGGFTTQFLTDGDKLIANVMYDNKACQYRVFV